jgi:NADPH-ferrihemoprotein reductase
MVWTRKQQKQNSPQLDFNMLYVFFGARNRHSDYLYEQEWKQLESEGICQYSSCFSRDQPEKRYVQHLLFEQSELIYQVIVEECGSIMIAGNTKMLKDIRSTIIEIIQKHSSWTLDEINQFIRSIEQQKKYLVEAW